MTLKKVSAILYSVLLATFLTQAQDKIYPNEFPLGSVKLLDGPFKQAMDLNVTHLLKYTVDRLLYCYRKEAGLPTGGASNYTNWAGLDGHVGGHYLTAMAMQYAATGDAQCKQRMDAMVTELKKCQDANGSDAVFKGYLSGIPDGKALFRRVKGGETGAVWDGWVPWYNIHKTYAGLRDAWVYGGNETAKAMFLSLCDWGISICAGLTDAQMQSMLGNEHGGVNEMYADAYQMTNDAKYLAAAKRFSHKWLLDAMAKSTDNLDDVHANTQVPKAVGFIRIGEVANDNTYYKAADFFWETVTTKRSIALGGNSRNEFFPKASACMDYINGREGVESCNTHNMMKLTEGLFRMKPDAKYADFYERAMFNHILSTQHPTHGGYVYFTPAHPRHYRVYSAPDVAMWCCVGTGMENHTKYGQFIYTHTSDSLFVNLFVASELDWSNRGIQVKQETKFPDQSNTVLTINTNAQKAFKLCIRHPYWVPKGKMKVIIETDTLGLDSEPSSYVIIPRTWNGGEVVTVSLPMQFNTEELINVPSYSAIMCGPIVMGAKTGTDGLTGLIADAGRMGHVASGTLMDVSSAPKLKIDRSTFRSKFQPVSGKTLTFKAPDIFQNSADANLVFEPFFRIHDARYMMYWNATVTGTYPSDDVVAVSSPIPKQVKQAGSEIIKVNEGIKFSFKNTDPSRRVVICSLSGRKVADIPAVTENVSFTFNNRENRIGNGTYIVQIKSDTHTFSDKLFVAGR